MVVLIPRYNDLLWHDEQILIILTSSSLLPQFFILQKLLAEFFQAHFVALGGHSGEAFSFGSDCGLYGLVVAFGIYNGLHIKVF